MKETLEIRMAGWAAMVEARNESGLTIKEWCAQNNLSETAYYYRLRQLRKAALDSAELQTDACTQVQEVQFAKISPPGSGSSSGMALRITRGGTSIEVSNDASDSILAFLKEVIAYAV